jgi:hypothetical protein
MDGVTGINWGNVIIRPPMRTGIRDAFLGCEHIRVIFDHPAVRALRFPQVFLQCRTHGKSAVQICYAYLLIFIKILR